MEKSPEKFFESDDVYVGSIEPLLDIKLDLKDLIKQDFLERYIQSPRNKKIINNELLNYPIQFKKNSIPLHDDIAATHTNDNSILQDKRI